MALKGEQTHVVSSKGIRGICPGLREIGGRADTPELREKLLNLAREWMRAVMEAEDSDCKARSRRPVATALRRDRRIQAARPPSSHSDEAPSL